MSRSRAADLREDPVEALMDRLQAQHPEWGWLQVQEAAEAEIIRASLAGDRTYVRALAEEMLDSANDGSPEAERFFRELLARRLH
jgi:hypothetical protein